MEPARDGVLLRVFVGEADRAGGHSLYRAVIDAAFKGGIAGATILHGPMGFGRSRLVNNEFIVDSPGNLPIPSAGRRGLGTAPRGCLTSVRRGGYAYGHLPPSRTVPGERV